MANNVFVGFNLPASGQSTTESEDVRELQPLQHGIGKEITQLREGGAARLML